MRKQILPVDVRAQLIATKAHAGQTRRDGCTPYIKHPEAVAARVSSAKAKAVAWLHDVLEDCDVDEESLRKEQFDEEIIQAVSLLTKRDGLTEAQYLAGIKGNELASEVKIADMLANLSDSPTRTQIRRYATMLLELVPG
jgi:(p)ppGpp synthase/HD superfamily hydrolase